MSKKEIEKYFEDIVGYEKTKNEMFILATILRETEKRDAMGIRAPRGILFYGDPGLGKTSLAIDLMNASERFPVIFRKENVQNKFAASLKTAFEQAKKNQPSVILLDDMDKYSNSDEDHTDTDEYVAIQSCIDSVKNEDVFVIATANDIDYFPRSLLRAGRFDRKISIDTPSVSEATKIIQSYLTRTQCENDIDANAIAKLMTGRSCAALETIINEAGIYAVDRGLDKINMQCLVDACLTIFFNSPEGADYLTHTDAELFAVHEAGHAVAQELLIPGSVAMVSTRINRGNTQGITVFDNDWISYRENYHLKLIMCGLAGRAAVELKYGVCDPGAEADIRHAVAIADNAVQAWCCNGITISTENAYKVSDSITSKLNHEANDLLNRCYADVKRLLLENMGMVDKVAEELLQRKTLLGKDIRQLIAD